MHTGMLKPSCSQRCTEHCGNSYAKGRQSFLFWVALDEGLLQPSNSVSCMVLTGGLVASTCGHCCFNLNC